MILHRDLQLASVLTLYMKHGGNKKNFYSDCLTAAHILRRIDEEVNTTNIISKLNKLLNEVFMLYMRPLDILTPYEMRLYLRVFITSRLTPVIKMWNSILDVTQTTKEELYDVINAENINENVVCMFFSNEMGEYEKSYVALPTDILKTILVRTTTEVKTFANSNAQRIHRIVYTTNSQEPITEENTFPIKVYEDTDIEEQHVPFLNGKYIISDQ